MRREIGRVQRRIEVVKGAGEFGRRGAPIHDGRGNILRAGGVHAEIHQQAKQVLLRGGVDVELGGLRDDIDHRLAFREIEREEGHGRFEARVVGMRAAPIHV
jgi:hypothetical protein